MISGVMIQYFNVQPFIATLAMMFLARGLASILSHHAGSGSPRTRRSYCSPPTGRSSTGRRSTTSSITPGLHHRGARRDRRRSSSCTARRIGPHGLRDRRQRVVGAAHGSAGRAHARVGSTSSRGALPGLAAVVYTAEVGGKAQNVTGIGWELDAIAAVVIGGTLLTGGAGYVLGSVVGVFVIAALRLIITKDGSINPEYLTIITGAVLLVFVLLQRVLTRQEE